VDLCSALFVAAHTQSAQVLITVLFANPHTILPQHCKRSAGGAATDCSGIHAPSYYSFIDPERMKG